MEATSQSPFYPDDALVRPIAQTTRRFWFVTAILLFFVLAGIVAWIYQLKTGLSVTGLNVPVYWGVYITNFVFFIGISHAGTLISAILRLTNAEWRRSITRAAEVITVMVIVFGAGSIILDLGRPDRALNVILHANLRSPLLWDVMSITVYLISSAFYLYLPLIPDIAILRDGLGKRRFFYRILALGCRGTERQHAILERMISVMAILVVPIAISVHTVVSYVFAMTVQPMWHSAIFGPYFVVGAIFSGIAALIIAMAIIRWAYGLEGYLKEVHFDNLGKLLLVMSLLWFYFTFGEFLTTFYGGAPEHMIIFWSKVTGRYALLTWTMVTCCFVVPMITLTSKRMRTIRGTVIASAAIVVGMWIERYTIVVPSLSRPRLALAEGFYLPSFTEIVLTLAAFAGFILLYLLFTKFFPIVSIWEIREGREHAVAEVEARIRSYAPESEGSESE